ALLAIEKLQHYDAGHMLLQVGVDAGNRDANAAIGVTNLVAKDLGRDRNERQYCEGDQRHLPVHVQHDDQNARQQEDVLEDGHHSGGKHLVQSIHIAGDPRDQPANRIAVEERDVQPLQVAENLAAQVEHYLLPGPLHYVRLGELQQEAEQQEADIHEGNLRDAGERAWAEEAVEQRVRLG